MLNLYVYNCLIIYVLNVFPKCPCPSFGKKHVPAYPYRVVSCPVSVYVLLRVLVLLHGGLVFERETY